MSKLLLPSVGSEELLSISQLDLYFCAVDVPYKKTRRIRNRKALKLIIGIDLGNKYSQQPDRYFNTLYEIS
jgi:hypothetical protein